MHLQSVVTILAFTATALSAARPPPGYPYPYPDPQNSTSSTSVTSAITGDPDNTSRTSTSSTPSTTGSTSSSSSSTSSSACPTAVTITSIRSTCPATTGCPTRSTTTATDTVTRFSTRTTTRTIFVTSTPGPVVDLIAYEERLCGADPVDRNGNPPNFQQIQLTLPTSDDGTPSYGSSNCARTTQDPASFSWDVVSFDDVPANCDVRFYTGDSCFDENGGYTNINMVGGQNECHNLRRIRSVQLVCGRNA
ncbi:hypothetical protein LTR37_009572 [Vermiconidia calcicola]|uniref:Uncharacterized protein n=1 Tax=Vermiconidia calcicola TaxID=1690605 RepID=A0ACC3N8T0_9PEZI|nr:hypothetical protein LTR37_009572 [Vermiconidia calcicola]